MPPFDKRFLEVWVNMAAVKIRGFEEDARRAEEELEKKRQKQNRQKAQAAISAWAPQAKL